MKTYINQFYSPKIQGSAKEYEANEKPVIYKGYEIHHRTKDCFDIVQNNVCIAMRAGINGAKQFIDEKENNLEGEGTL